MVIKKELFEAFVMKINRNGKSDRVDSDSDSDDEVHHMEDIDIDLEEVNVSENLAPAFHAFCVGAFASGVAAFGLVLLGVGARPIPEVFSVHAW